MWHQFQTQKWEPPFLTSRSQSETLNIFIKPVDTSRLLIIFLDNKWTIHLYHNSFAIYYSSSLLYMLMRHHGCSRPQLQRCYHSTFLSEVPLCTFSVKLCFARGISGEGFSQIVPVFPIPFFAQHTEKGQTCKKSCRNRQCMAEDALEGDTSIPKQQQLQGPVYLVMAGLLISCLGKGQT